MFLISEIGRSQEIVRRCFDFNAPGSMTSLWRNELKGLKKLFLYFIPFRGSKLECKGNRGYIQIFSP